ncbi:MAG: PAS domain S-box protein, partial [Syntrophales bacterium LBB04]|nr:PAS domain S-box protein [Syntrophales bacterium LBB04]
MFILNIAERKRAEGALRQVHDELEQRVTVRTEELQQANKKLQIQIAERQQVEQALRKSQEQLSHFIESANDWTWELDRNGVYTFSSSHCIEILGYRPEEIIGKIPFDLMPPEEAARVQLIFDSYVTEQKPFYRLENLNRGKDGRVVVLETNGVPVIDEMGQFQGYRGMDRDVTKRKQLEEVLRESKEKYRILIENTNAMVFQTTLSGTFLTVNRTFVDSAGYDSVEDLMSTPASSMYADPADRERLKELLIRHGEVRNWEVQAQKKNGTNLWISINATMLPGKDGKPETILGIASDITERKRIEESLTKSEKNLRILSNLLINAQENERKRIAFELHDELGQSLVGLKFQLSGLQKKSSGTPTDFTQAIDAVNGMTENVRRLSRELRPSVLEHLGLLEGL